MYNYIVINGNQFSFFQRKEKLAEDGLALLTLQRIEEILEKRLTYSNGVNGVNNSSLPEVEREALVRARLRKIALSVKENFLRKSKKLSSIQRFFGNVAQKEEAIRAVSNRIGNLPINPPLTDLPKELMSYGCSFLQETDLGKWGILSKKANNYKKKAEIERAREFGYKGDDSNEAKKFLNEKFDAVKFLVKAKIIPYRHVVRRGHDKSPIDCEATLKNIRANEELFKVYFGEQILDHLFAAHNRGGDSICIETIRALLILGADPNFRNEFGYTALHQLSSMWVSKEKRWKLFELLLDYGADIYNITVGGGIIYSSDPKCVELLCKKGGETYANFQAPATGQTPLHWAVNNHAIESVKILLKYGADPNLIAHNGTTPLTTRSRCYDKEMVEVLLNGGAKINLPGFQGITILQKAIKDGKRKLIPFLLEAGADPNIADDSGNTALHRAVMMDESRFWLLDKKWIEEIRLLLARGANPRLVNHLGETPLALSSNSEVRELLQFASFRTHA